jgi:hypothetical protein
MIKNIREKSPPRFSYLIRPITPCIFGTEDYNDEQANDDEFFLTAGGIVHSCPNIYELSIENQYKQRQLQSCDHFMFIHKQTTSVYNHLNTYDTKLDRYSIIPRFQPIASSISTDSINSEIELYRKRHAIGLTRRSISSSLLPTTWKSDNYLFFMSILHHQFSFATSIDNHKRSRSYDIPILSLACDSLFYKNP